MSDHHAPAAGVTRQQLKSWRVAAGLSHARAARRLGLAATHLAAIENGWRPLPRWLRPHGGKAA